jgi:hypothetical protein
LYAQAMMTSPVESRTSVFPSHVIASQASRTSFSYACGGMRIIRLCALCQNNNGGGSSTTSVIEPLPYCRYRGSSLSLSFSMLLLTS